ncbi:MAG TPA: glutamate-1-semialdehyde 2,1-aminomutase [Leptospiraceae bacterium]|nr:glutamate-1-semialdehyde 2,1-aminomutase [Leptospiraceae bacterium]HMY67553.1 glutamate-1-semialdehyde 2,1-aminomutase [Leptospiraceae bacterium]HNF16013.1 glutamate-1-semialdehyde 2,1-aminomutase [Leptospiraceae bacterium]HNF27280.1 glutamate-1-semialdehyde 2,1-aminomutase [Leptospiraceae bacterium]HNI99116.1 glutamate-1-semialdehyde 2,1-aminomutase [Leptospiraceae bacterium]
MNSEELFQRSKKVSPGGVHSPVRSFRSVGGTPVFFSKGDGAVLTDVEGKEYIDYCLSFGPLILGHRDREVEETVKETVSLAWSFGACEPYSLELAEFITSEIPWAEKVRFVSSGTEAVMSALRVARAAAGRDKILKFDGCYHGHLDSLLVKSGSGLAGEPSSDSAGISTRQMQDTLVIPLNDRAKLDQIFAEHGKEIAAVIIEPMPANYGLLKQSLEFLEYMTETAHKHGSLVIFDEVISGFRIGFQGMSAKVKNKPDLVTYGKIIGGGFPVGAYAGRKDLMDMVAPAGPVYQAGTLSGSPFGMRAGLATLKKLKRDKIHDKLRIKTEKFCNEFVSILNQKSDSEWAADFEDSVFWFHEKTLNPIRTIEEIPATHKEKFAKLFHSLLKNGVYLAPSGYEVGFLSNAHSDEILDRTLSLLAKALS